MNPLWQGKTQARNVCFACDIVPEGAGVCHVSKPIQANSKLLAFSSTMVTTQGCSHKASCFGCIVTGAEASSCSKSPKHKVQANRAGSTVQLQLFTENSAHCVQAHLLLNAACGDEPVHIHLLLLAITPHPGSSLLVCCRVPVWRTVPAVKLHA